MKKPAEGKARLVHLWTEAKFDRATRGLGSVVIDRERGLVTARRLRARTSYTLTLDHVADMICAAVTRAELARRMAQPLKLTKRPPARRRRLAENPETP